MAGQLPHCPEPHIPDPTSVRVPPLPPLFNTPAAQQPAGQQADAVVDVAPRAAGGLKAATPAKAGWGTSSICRPTNLAGAILGCAGLPGGRVEAWVVSRLLLHPPIHRRPGDRPLAPLYARCRSGRHRSAHGGAARPQRPLLWAGLSGGGGARWDGRRRRAVSRSKRLCLAARLARQSMPQLAAAAFTASGTVARIEPVPPNNAVGAFPFASPACSGASRSLLRRHLSPFILSPPPCSSQLVMSAHLSSSPAAPPVRADTNNNNKQKAGTAALSPRSSCALSPVFSTGPTCQPGSSHCSGMQLINLPPAAPLRLSCTRAPTGLHPQRHVVCKGRCTRLRGNNRGGQREARSRWTGVCTTAWANWCSCA